MHFSDLMKLFGEVVEKIPFGIGNGIGTAIGSRVVQYISSDNREHQELINRLQRIEDQQAEQAAASNKQKEEWLLLAGIGLGIFSAFITILPVSPLAIAIQGSAAGVILVKFHVLKAE